MSDEPYRVPADAEPDGVWQVPALVYVLFLLVVLFAVHCLVFALWIVVSQLLDR